MKSYSFLLFIASVLFFFANQSGAVLSATTAQTIKGNSPRFVQSIEIDIELKQAFKYFGVVCNGNAYFNTPDLNAALGVNISSQTPASLNLSSVLAMPAESEVIDGDGQLTLSEASTDSVQVDWYYEDTAGSEIRLTTVQKNNKFTSLITSGIYPYIKVWGNVALNTQYGDPYSQPYPDSSIAMTQVPFKIFNVSVGSEAIKFANPNMTYATGIYTYGDASKFDPTTGNGFVSQDDYLNNFPSTGANGLYFYIVTSGINNSLATTQWNVKTSNIDDNSPNAITATVVKSVAPGISGFKTYNAGNMVLVKLKGPDASSKSVGLATAPSANLPVDIEIIGKTKQEVIVSYKFRITKWFINRGNITNIPSQQKSWCEGLGDYQQASVRDLSNARHARLSDNKHNYYNYKRAMHEGLITEWGVMSAYSGANFYNATYGWTSTVSTNGNTYYVRVLGS